MAKTRYIQIAWFKTVSFSVMLFGPKKLEYVVWAHKTSSTPPLLIKAPATSQASLR